MIDVNVAEFARQNPDIALEVFNNTEAALQEILPDSEYHPRYEHAHAVGLAVVIAPADLSRGDLNPTGPNPLDRVVFLGTNESAHPEAWPALEADGGMIGGVPAESIGRFTAFALAKAEELNNGAAHKSYHPDKLTIAPGRVGLAGARRIGREPLSTSGLLEVHDDSVTLHVARELIRSGRTRGYRSSVDQMASTLQGSFDLLQLAYPEIVEVTPTNRSKLTGMLATNTEYFDLDNAA